MFTREGRITLKTFASVPTLADLPEIKQQLGSVSDVSSLRGADNYGIDLAEGCVLTKSVKYTHQLVHWVHPVHSGDPREVVSRKLIGAYSPQLLNYLLQEHFIEFDLGIIPFEYFSLDDSCNLAYRTSEEYAS